MYDPRVGRFLSVDPLTKDYPAWSPFPFAMNNPVEGIDLGGVSNHLVPGRIRIK
jgi:RHS repeat-associated protein